MNMQATVLRKLHKPLTKESVEFDKPQGVRGGRAHGGQGEVDMTTRDRILSAQNGRSFAVCSNCLGFEAGLSHWSRRNSSAFRTCA